MSIFERLPFDGEPIGKPPPSAPTADPTAPLVKWHRELFGMGVAFDVLIVGICLYSLFLSAVEEDHAPLFVLVIQAAFAFAELGRAPLAYAARVLSSAAWRNGCAAGVIVLGFVTAFNLFMPFNQGLRDRLVRVQEAKAELEAAKAENATFQVGYEKALKDKADAENRVKDDTARTTGASADYAKTPRICGKGGHCHADRELGKNLADARIDKKADRDDLTAAKKTLNGMNPKTTSDKVLAKEAALHRAFNKNSVLGGKDARRRKHHQDFRRGYGRIRGGCVGIRPDLARGRGCVAGRFRNARTSGTGQSRAASGEHKGQAHPKKRGHRRENAARQSRETQGQERGGKQRPNLPKQTGHHR
jgi:hypothetical protein